MTLNSLLGSASALAQRPLTYWFRRRAQIPLTSSSFFLMYVTEYEYSYVTDVIF